MLRKRLRERLNPHAVESLEQIPFVPDDTKIASAQLKLLKKGIDALPPQRKKVFELCKLEGRSYEEAAAILHLSKNTVKTHLSRALDMVKEYIISHPGDALLIASLVAMLER